MSSVKDVELEAGFPMQTALPATASTYAAQSTIRVVERPGTVSAIRGALEAAGRQPEFTTDASWKIILEEGGQITLVGTTPAASLESRPLWAVWTEDLNLWQQPPEIFGRIDVGPVRDWGIFASGFLAPPQDILRYRDKLDYELLLLRIEQEEHAFNRMRHELIADRRYAGRFVAILDGKVVDSDVDDQKLAVRMIETFGERPMFIGFVGSPSKVLIPTPL
jgi:hypothetical protein